VAGYETTPEEVMQSVVRDRAVYRNSGGGLTVSGGELTMQWEFALELLRLAKQEGMNTAIETCGSCQWEILERLLEYTDYVMYDIKCVDDERHRQGTGVGNGLILENAKKIAAHGKVLFRMPLIPGYNDSTEWVEALARFVRDETGLDETHIELLQYNNLGEEKFDRLGREGEKPTLQRQDDEVLQRLNQAVSAVFAEGSGC
jgi:pyruvate formate lyase activating enzyme